MTERALFHPASLKARLRPASYWLVFTVPGTMPLAWYLVETTGNFLWTMLPLVWLYAILPMTDWLVGRDSGAPVASQDVWLNRRLIPWLCLPIQLLLIGWALTKLNYMPIWAQALWIFSLGYIGGMLAINVAHELIHRRNRLDRVIGGLLLCSVNYVTFKIEHVRGHHVWVATERDPSTARRGESIYRFLPRAMITNTINGWKLEAVRMRRIGQPVISLKNEMIGWHAVILLMMIAAYALAGWIGVLAFLVQGLIAAASLEIINYVEHYGLRRKQLDNGRYERPTPMHSWNSDFWISNGILLQLQRHSDHHANPSRPFTQLRSWPEAPQLPLGYSAMLPMALIPPLWRRVMHPRLDRYQSSTQSAS